MFLYDNACWIADIDKVIPIVLPELNALAGKSVMITGATGLIGSAVVDVLFRYNDTHKNKIQILAAGRSISRMRERFGRMVDRDEFGFVGFDASGADNHINIHADYIIHAAANAFPKVIMDEPVETMTENFLGMKVLLDYAKEQRTERVLFISSSEVYGRKDDAGAFSEDQYGYVDILSTRSAYAVAKRATETLCVSYAAEYGVDSVIVRPGHIYGPTASPNDNRVSSAWAYAAAKGEDIVMKSAGSQIRSYCYCLDCATALLKVLACGECGQAYNISNPDSIISIRQMAEMLATAGGVQIQTDCPSEEERKGFNPMDNSSLDGGRLMSLGWRGCFDAETGLRHTVDILKAIR